MTKNDNRNYSFGSNSNTIRGEYELISKFIKRNCKVIDLGCGDGSLLKLLKDKKNIKEEGIEITTSGVQSANKKKLNVTQGRIDQKLNFKDKEFDFAICNVTLQMVMYPEILLKEMNRISKKQIVTFPNFAYLFNRLELLLKGIMPKTMIPGYTWFSTGHIHQLSIKDFQDFCFENKISIIGNSHVYPERIYGFKLPFMKNFPNLFTSTAIFITE
jgi:methionine biosynthesis protein MetW